MKKLMMLIAVVGMMFSMSAGAQDIAADWQGTLKVGKDLRLIMHIYKGDKDGYSATMYSIDQTPQPIPATSVTRDGVNVKIAIDMIQGGYEGKLGADAKMMTGTYSQGGKTYPLDLVKATPETAWGIPEAPKPDKPMAEDADPSFDVATIKPNITGGPNMQQLTMIKRDFVVKNGTLEDLIGFAYDMQVKQIVGGPDWISKDRYSERCCDPRRPGPAKHDPDAEHGEKDAGRPLCDEVPQREARDAGLCTNCRKEWTEADAVARSGEFCRGCRSAQPKTDSR